MKSINTNNFIMLVLLSMLLGLSALSARAEPGYRWELKMEMEGMALPGMGQGKAQCLPARRADTPGMDSKECQLLDSKQTGNRYYWKARCDRAISTGDFTYLSDTAYKGTITMEEEGEKFVMKVSGKRLDKCEYSEPKIVMPVAPKFDCGSIIDTMALDYVFAPKAICADKKKEVCKRLGNLSPEGFAKVADQVGMENQAGNQMKDHVRMADALKSCGLRLESLQMAQCRRASQASDMDFLRRYCPAELDAVCASGRAYTGYCSKGKAMSGQAEGAGMAGSSGQSGSSAASQGAEGTVNPGESVAEEVGKGLNKLKGLFGW